MFDKSNKFFKAYISLKSIGELSQIRTSLFNRKTSFVSPLDETWKRVIKLIAAKQCLENDSNAKLQTSSVELKVVKPRTQMPLIYDQ